MTKVHKLNDIKRNRSWNDVESTGIIDIIRNYHLAKVLTALYRANIIEKIKSDEPIKTENFPECNSYLLGHLFHYLSIHDIFTVDDNGDYYLTEKGRGLLSDPGIAHLCFYSEAYADITSNIDKFLTNKASYGKDITRNGKSLGIHCDTLFREYHTASVFEAIKDLDAKKILDIGCGGGQFLVDVCRNSDTLTGVGLDISEPAIVYAKENATQLNLSSRLSFVVADAFDLSTWPQDCFDADILTAAGVIHEHFRDGEQAVIDILNTYAELLKDKGFKAIVLGEPEIRYDLIKSDSDLYLVHIFTAQGFPHYREEWLELFKKTKLKCEDVYTRPFAGPRFNFFVLTI